VAGRGLELVPERGRNLNRSAMYAGRADGSINHTTKGGASYDFRFLLDGGFMRWERPTRSSGERHGQVSARSSAQGMASEMALPRVDRPNDPDSSSRGR